jgi:tight adherence protein B
MLSALVTVVAGSVATMALVRAARGAGVRGRATALSPKLQRARLPQLVRDPLSRALTRADIAWEAEDVVVLWGVAALAVGLLGLALSPGAGVAAAVACVMAGPVCLRLARDRADLRAVRELPAVLERAATALRAGAGPLEALDQLAERDGPLGPDLRRVRARRRLGTAAADALTTWAAERPRAEVRAAAGALHLSIAIGGASAAALDGLAATLRVREASRRDAVALSAQARVSAIVVGAAPIVFLLFGSATDPRTLGTLLGTGAGRACLVVGLALEALGALWMRRIVRPAA